MDQLICASLSHTLFIRRTEIFESDLVTGIKTGRDLLTGTAGCLKELGAVRG